MTAARLNRIRWLCRRGMKELDVLLERFVASEAGALEANRWPEFESMLSQEDDQLWDWIQQPQQAPSGEFREMILAITRSPAA